MIKLPLPKNSCNPDRLAHRSLYSRVFSLGRCSDGYLGGCLAGKRTWKRPVELVYVFRFLDVFAGPLILCARGTFPDVLLHPFVGGSSHDGFHSELGRSWGRSSRHYTIDYAADCRTDYTAASWAHSLDEHS